MDEYIKRETAIEAVRHAWGKGLEPTQYIEEIPAADVVEVVWCRECKHCDPETQHCDNPMGTTLPLPRKTNDFCSYGERKGGADG